MTVNNKAFAIIGVILLLVLGGAYKAWANAGAQVAALQVQLDTAAAVTARDSLALGQAGATLDSLANVTDSVRAWAATETAVSRARARAAKHSGDSLVAAALAMVPSDMPALRALLQEREAIVRVERFAWGMREKALVARVTSLEASALAYQTKEAAWARLERDLRRELRLALGQRDVLRRSQFPSLGLRVGRAGKWVLAGAGIMCAMRC